MKRIVLFSLQVIFRVRDTLSRDIVRGGQGTVAQDIKKV